MEDNLVDIDLSNNNVRSPVENKYNQINTETKNNKNNKTNKNNKGKEIYDIIFFPFLFLFSFEYVAFMLLVLNCVCVDSLDNTLVLFCVINNFCIFIDYIHFHTFVKIIMRKLTDKNKDRDSDNNHISKANTKRSCVETSFLIFGFYKLLILQIYYTYLIIVKLSVITNAIFKCLFIGHYIYFFALFLIYNRYIFVYIRK
jgi:hypothetical protein